MVKNVPKLKLVLLRTAKYWEWIFVDDKKCKLPCESPRKIRTPRIQGVRHQMFQCKNNIDVELFEFV